jgi:hypothetical protein
MRVVVKKDTILPDESGSEPSYIPHMGWHRGYPFCRFFGNVLGYLEESIGALAGMQQLIHHYYLQNGELGARITAERIMKFIGECK